MIVAWRDRIRPVLLNEEKSLPADVSACRSGISYCRKSLRVSAAHTEDNLLAIWKPCPYSERAAPTAWKSFWRRGLETVRHSNAYMLSGGERRRLEIARVADPATFVIPAGRAFFGD